MRVTNQATDDAILHAVGERVERQRIEASMTQAELAKESGISKRTLERIEGGSGCELLMLVRVLRTLKLVEGFNALVPDLPPSPMAQLKLKGKQRRRVGRPRGGTPSAPATSSSTTTPSTLPHTSTPPHPPTPAPSPVGRKPWTWEEK